MYSSFKIPLHIQEREREREQKGLIEDYKMLISFLQNHLLSFTNGKISHF